MFIDSSYVEVIINLWFGRKFWEICSNKVNDEDIKNYMKSCRRDLVNLNCGF